MLGPPESWEVLLQVRAVGLTFGDILNILGSYPPDIHSLGAQAAGVVVSDDVLFCQAGGAAFGLAYAPIASFTSTAASLLAPKPAGVSFEEASALPVAWCMAHQALEHAALRSDQHCVIHALVEIGTKLYLHC